MTKSLNSALRDPLSGPRVPLIIAHRGASGLAPENTLAAFKLAIAQGADGVELDVQLTADGCPIVIHDKRVNRTTNGAGIVTGLTLDQIHRLDAGAWFDRRLRIRPRIRAMAERTAPPGGNGAHFAGEPVPTLESVLATMVGSTRPLLYIELKTASVRRLELLESVVSLVRRFRTETSVTLLSFDHEIIALAKRQAPEIRTAATFPTSRRRLVSANSVIRETARAGADEAALHVSLATRRTVEALHKRGLSVSVWTANSKLVLRHLIACGVDSIITNYPDRLVGLLGSKQDASWPRREEPR
jgi:glycerophosphoryl diester phosphodiesterase